MKRLSRYWSKVPEKSRATEVTVNLAFYPEAVSLMVQDNGVGFDFAEAKVVDRRGGFGLVGMEARICALGGTFSVRSERGKGTVVEARIPTH